MLMCGIFGIISTRSIIASELSILANHAEQRGRDSSGLVTFDAGRYEVHRADFRIRRLINQTSPFRSNVVMGHSRLITNGLNENQPVLYDEVAVLHNGIIVNHESIWANLEKSRNQTIDSEVIAAISAQHVQKGGLIEDLSAEIFKHCQGVANCAVIFPRLGKICLLTNNGSLYLGKKESTIYFSSERFPLERIKCTEITGVEDFVILNIPQTEEEFQVHDYMERNFDIIPQLKTPTDEIQILERPTHNLLRCTRCILPETMPFIRFDNEGVCNYCNHYKIRNQPKPFEEMMELVNPYRRTNGRDCIVPLSGGRDSCFALHLIVNELGMRPVTFTYDWGMVTDLGRRNISRMCAELGIENIIIADDIEKKRRYIRDNLVAWLKSPNLGMISILTAGDKHFFRHLKTIQNQTGIDLNLWGINPLEITHFKAGFLGVPPDFEETRVYSHGAMKQLRYQSLRLKAMTDSKGYFNRSLWDTLSGEYYRSFSAKNDYYHIFDYWRWNEDEIDETLDRYNWERAPDTSTTWRIGDGTAAFYNYVYYTVAGFTEHDTFRSNQIREGDITREHALQLVNQENTPRYQNIKWYLDVLGMDFTDVVNRINSIPRLY